MAAHRATTGARGYLALGAVVAVAAMVMLKGLGNADVCGLNEAVEGLALQQMVEHGALLFPLLNGHDPSFKPPMFHWTAAALDALAGVRKVSAFDLRLPSALYAIAGLILTVYFTYSWLGRDGALLAGLILAGSYQFVSQARLGRVDMTLSFFENLGLLSFLQWWRERAEGSEGEAGPWLSYVCGISLGLAVLAKGPVGLVVPAVAIALFVTVEQGWHQARRFFAPGPIILMVAIGSSWYLKCWQAGHYGFLRRQIASENLGRFFGALGAMAPWYYAKPLLLNSVPFSLLAPVAVMAAIGEYRGRLRAGPGSDEPSARADAAARGLAIFWVVTVVFFSLAAYKRRAYLLPLWPGAAALLAWWLGRLGASRWAKAARIGVAGAGGVTILFNLIFIPILEVSACGEDSMRPAAEEILRVIGPRDPLFSYGMGGELAPLLFYLDRNAPELSGKLGDAPPGYVLVPAKVWESHRAEALELEPVLEHTAGSHPLVLLRHGRVYARRRPERAATLEGGGGQARQAS